MKGLGDYSRGYVPKIEDLSKACLEFSILLWYTPLLRWTKCTL